MDDTDMDISRGALGITDDSVMLCCVSSNNFRSVHIRGTGDYR